MLRDLLPSICYNLRWTELVTLARSNRAVRSIIYPDQPSQPQTQAAGRDCWRHVSTVVVRFGPNQGHNREGDNRRISLEIDGIIYHSLTNEMLLQLPQPPTTATLLAAAPSIVPTVLYPLVPVLLSFFPCMRWIPRLEYHHDADGMMNVLFSLLAVLPAFPRLHHLSLHLSPKLSGSGIQYMEARESEAEFQSRSCLVNAIFSCLPLLPTLKSIELGYSVPRTRRHPEYFSAVADESFAVGVLSKLLAEKLTHAILPTDLLCKLLKFHPGRPPMHIMGTISQTSVLPTAFDAEGFPFSRSDLRMPLFPSVQSLIVQGTGTIPVQQLVAHFPSLHVLTYTTTPINYCVPSRFASQLRFLCTVAHARGLSEVLAISSYVFLHSLVLQVLPEMTGPDALEPLTRLAQLTELRQLTVDVSSSGRRYGISQTKEDALWDLSWLCYLTNLRYLHIKAPRHLNRLTLESLGVLATGRAKVLAVCNWVESLGLEICIDRLGKDVTQALTLDAWTKLRRCCVWSTNDGDCFFQRHVSILSEQGNAILREKVGIGRFVSKEELMRERYDQLCCNERYYM